MPDATGTPPGGITVTPASGESQVTLDLAGLYRLDPTKTVLELTGSHHANHVMVQLLQRDAYIDFLSIPGVMRDGKHVIQGVRIQLSFQTAFQLLKTLEQVMESARRNPNIEKFPSEPTNSA